MTKIMRAVLIMKADLEAAELSSYQHADRPRERGNFSRWAASVLRR